MGAEPKKLGVPGEDELAARGVSYCATCDAAFFRDKPTIVVGGGDTAMEDALFLAKFAKDVKIVHRRDEFRASAIMLDRAKDTENIELRHAVRRRDVRGRRRRVARDGRAEEQRRAARTAALRSTARSSRSAISRTRQIVEGQVELDDEGYVLTQDKSTRTNLAGVFAAGDLVDHTYRQAVTAAGSGCQAALDAEWYLRDRPPDPEAHWAPKDEATAPAAPR